ncbi:HIT family protein [Candidatus Pacearchaeota archaeon]|nr:HIT family protein [Candidatus Pacearchaeota archaeon]
MKNCIFCKIVKGEITSIKIWEDKRHIAILDVNPINPGHVLVVPRKHDDYLFDISEKEYEGLMLTAKNIAILIKSKLNPKRVGLVVEGFAVPHIHVHLVPINNGNELNPERAKPSSKEELNKIASKLKN